MKTPFLKTLAVVTLVALAWQADAVTLSVSPAVTGSTYSGVITLDITGLTNTEKVAVQKWVDANTNGVIDAGDLLIDEGKIMDGGASVIGGITNLNVPFDHNPAADAITTTFNCPPGIPLENLVGNYIFTVVSPTGHFAPVTAAFAITNAALNQSVQGVVFSNGVPSPYAVVVAQDLQAGSTAGATVADAGGHYFMTLPAGGYGFIAVARNCYFDQKAAPTFALTNGVSVTTNLFLTGGGANTISGSVYDAGNSNAVGGVLLQFQSGALFAVAFTDTNGNYSTAVSPSDWTIKPSKERLARHGSVVPETPWQVSTTPGNVTNANLALPKGNALFYGRITDNLNHPFANVEIDCSGGSDNSGGLNLYSAKGYSDTNGYFTVPTLGDLTNYWQCSVNNGKNTVIGGYVVDTFNNVTNAPGQTTLENFTALPATATITGQVRDNSGTNVSRVSLNANAVIGGNNYQTLDGTTDNSGNYSLAVASGTWNVQFLTGGNDDSNLDHQGYEDLTAPHYVAVPPTNAVLNLTVYPIGTPVIGALQRISSTQFGFNINGAVNVNYTVQVSTNLAVTNWSPLLSFQLTTNPFPVVDVNATNKARFYRVQKN
jgi:hypothetical protein